MEQPIVGGGPFGNMMLNLGQLKTEKLPNLSGDQKFPPNSDIFKRKQLDGIYVDDPEVVQKFKELNVQRLEERLMENGNTEFFKMNGELKLDQDLLSDEMTRPSDLAFEHTLANATKTTSALLQDRSHSYKKKYFRLDVVIGRILMTNMSNFSEEDRLALRLKEQFRAYETRTSFAMIPFYQERVDFIEDEYEAKQT